MPWRLPHELQKEQRPSEPSRLVLPQIKIRREPGATHARDSLSGIEGSPGGPVLAVAGLELWDSATQDAAGAMRRLAWSLRGCGR